jgi:hypothetical protein
MQELDCWFSPWEYTHNSWIKDSIFNTDDQYKLRTIYASWCKAIGIKVEFSHYQNQWLEKFWLDGDNLINHIALLGCIVRRQKDDIIDNSLVKWAAQTSLARPIILLKPLQFKNNFEAGLNLLYQIMQCYCSAIWTRFVLKLPKKMIQATNIYDEPIISAKMILIIEKMWNTVSKKLAN